MPTHAFHRPPDPLFGIDPNPIHIPPGAILTDVTISTTSSRRGSILQLSKPRTGAMGEQTASVSWQLAPVPGSFVTYDVTPIFSSIPDGQGRVIVFADRDFKGEYLVVDNHISFADLNLAGFNDKISSLVVLNGRWIFFKDDLKTPYVDGTNVATILEPAMYPWVEDVNITNDDISSFKAISLP